MEGKQVYKSMHDKHSHPHILNDVYISHSVVAIIFYVVTIMIPPLSTLIG